MTKIKRISKKGGVVSSIKLRVVVWTVSVV